MYLQKKTLLRLSLLEIKNTRHWVPGAITARLRGAIFASQLIKVDHGDSRGHSHRARVAPRHNSP